jgi:hypothetical protein
MFVLEMVMASVSCLVGAECDPGWFPVTHPGKKRKRHLYIWSFCPYSWSLSFIIYWTQWQAQCHVPGLRHTRQVNTLQRDEWSSHRTDSEQPITGYQQLGNRVVLALKSVQQVLQSKSGVGRNKKGWLLTWLPSLRHHKVTSFLAKTYINNRKENHLNIFTKCLYCIQCEVFLATTTLKHKYRGVSFSYTNIWTWRMSKMCPGKGDEGILFSQKKYQGWIKGVKGLPVSSLSEARCSR